jgi:hypothetical protein
MAEDDINKEDKFDFTAEGEAFGYISLDQAVLRARLLVRQDEVRYLERLGWDEVVWAEINSDQREDTYRVVLQFRRPSRGLVEEQTGEEEFLFDLAGNLQDRQVLVWPEIGSMSEPAVSENPPALSRVSPVQSSSERLPSPARQSSRSPVRPATDKHVPQIDDLIWRSFDNNVERFSRASVHLSNLLGWISAWIRQHVEKITLLARRLMPLYFPTESEDQPSSLDTVLLCPQCHAEYKPGQRFCTSCGVGFDEPPSSGVSPAIEPLVTSNCSRCLAEYSPGQKFCTKCGAAIDAAPAHLPLPSTQPSSMFKGGTETEGDTPARNPHLLEKILSTWGSHFYVHRRRIIRIPIGVVLLLWGAFLFLGGSTEISQGALAVGLVILAGGGMTILSAGILLGWDKLRMGRVGKGMITFLLSVGGFLLFIVGVALTGI